MRNTLNERKNIKTRDPLLFIFWGLLLILYGLYMIYPLIKNIEKVNHFLLYLVVQIIMIIIGSIILFVGFRAWADARKL